VRAVRDLVAGTVIMRNYLPHARALSASLRAHQPNVRLVALLVDDLDDDAVPTEPFELLTVPEVGIDIRELHRRALIYEPAGLVSSLRAPFISYLLAREGAAVVLIDADMLALAELDDLWELASQHEILLSPHIVAAAGSSTEELLLTRGTFNGGLLGVGLGGAQFADWLATKTRRDCLMDLERGLFYGQMWLNLVPTLFPSHVQRDAGVNVTFHRLGANDLDRAGGAYLVGETPLRLYHFTGFDPAHRDRVSRHEHDTAAAHRPNLHALCAAYDATLREYGWAMDAPPLPWSTFADGRRVDAGVRDLYRDALIAAEHAGTAEPPNAFDAAEAEDFVDWLAAAEADAAVGAKGEPAVHGA
jgi:hypothetical protein